jgi:hypothetical protein
MKTLPPYQPDQYENQQFVELVDLFDTLKAKHARRRRSPLKFVEAYDDFVRAHAAFEPLAWPAIEQRVTGMREYTAVFFARDYEEAQGPAEEQQKRNVLWDEIYNPPRAPLEAGRADGNKS